MKFLDEQGGRVGGDVVLAVVEVMKSGDDCHMHAGPGPDAMAAATLWGGWLTPYWPTSA